MIAHTERTKNAFEVRLPRSHTGKRKIRLFCGAENYRKEHRNTYPPPSLLLLLLVGDDADDVVAHRGLTLGEGILREVPGVGFVRGLDREEVEHLAFDLVGFH
jgi:hypothetical protein